MVIGLRKLPYQTRATLHNEIVASKERYQLRIRRLAKWRLLLLCVAEIGYSVRQRWIESTQGNDVSRVQTNY